MQDTYATSGSNSNHDSLFGKDILVLSRSVIPEDDRFEESMSAPSTPSGSTTPTSPQDVNAAQVVYSKAKDVWTWGKGLPVVGFFEGVTESVVSKVVSIAGTSMSDIDGAVQNVVSSLDTSYLNPAIAAVVDAIMKGVGKADSTFRPMIESVAPSVLGISKPAESKERTEAPELTTAPVTKVN
jgi:flavin-binding protein dodecin